MIQVQHLTKLYGPRSAISDLNFEVAKGEIVGFLGPNGAGKSTTMKILSGFMPASDGTAKIAGYDVFENPTEVKKNVGFLPENPPVYFEMQVADYLDFCARLRNIPSHQRKAAVNQALEKTALGSVSKRLIGNLSKGYRQRVGLAPAILHNPAVLILDEPTVGLDPKQIIDIRQLIKSLAGEHTVILSSHILPEVTATCERVIVINKGRIVAVDTLEQLTARTKKGLIYSLSLRHPNDSGLDAIRKISGVADVRKEGDKVVVQISPEVTEIRDAIVSTAVQQGLGVLEFAAEKVSLEDIFLQLTTDENLGAASAAVTT